jgi:hypothetical protein
MEIKQSVTHVSERPGKPRGAGGDRRKHESEGFQTELEKSVTYVSEHSGEPERG